jgi:putative SOS response-associated peptidase YedK
VKAAVDISSIQDAANGEHVPMHAIPLGELQILVPRRRRGVGRAARHGARAWRHDDCRARMTRHLAVRQCRPVEGRRFPKGRCLVPASHFFEFTGAKLPKSKWKFTKAGEEWFCFAGLWRPMPDGNEDAFTLLTTEPGADVAPIHNRQVVILERADWQAWLDLTRREADLLRPLPAGSLIVDQVR